MEPRINVQEKGQKAMGAMGALGKYLAGSAIEQSLLKLIYFRVSQMNGCAMCLDMHARELRREKESEQRLYVLNAWRDAPFYTDRERSALAYAEALTKLPDDGARLPNTVYDGARKHFSDAEMIDLTIAVITINGYNRINIAFGAPVGSYRVGQYEYSEN